MQSSGIQKIVLVGLVAVVVFFSVYKLTESPPVWYDEGWYIQTAANLQSTGIDGIQLAPGNIFHVSTLTVGYPLIFPLAGWFALMGTDVFAGRTLMVVFILVLVFAASYFARRVWGTDMALGVLALMSTLPTLYGNGKSVLGEVPGLLYLVLFLLFFYNATASSNRKRAWLILSAIFAGLCVATKPLFILLIPAIFFAVIFECKHKTLKPADVFLASLAGLIPIIAWLFIQFRGVDSMQQVLSFYTNPYQIQNLGEVILQNAKHLFTDVGTLYLSIVMILWIGALSIKVNIKEKILGVEFISFWFSLLVILAFLRTAGWYRYLFPAYILALIFLPSILIFLANRTGQPVLKKTVLVIIVILAVFGFYQLGFNSWVAQSYQSTRTAEWTEYFRSMPPSVSVFFYNTPEVAIYIPHRNYFQYISAASIELGKENVGLIRQGVPNLIVTETDAYNSDRNFFGSYNIARQIDKYTILSRP